MSENKRNEKVERAYTAAYSELVQSVGIKLAEKVTKLVKHFHCAPKLQVMGYLVKVLKDDGITSQHLKVIMKIVNCRFLLEQQTDHSLAAEILRKKIGIPSYCFAYEKDHCKNCNGVLVM